MHKRLRFDLKQADTSATMDRIPLVELTLHFISGARARARLGRRHQSPTH